MKKKSQKADRLSWDDVQYFLQLSRKNTLEKAARALGVAHTTVLRRITSLEGNLEKKLFNRTRHGFVLTEAGEGFREHAELMETASFGIRQTGRSSENLDGVVRVAAIEGFATKILVPALAEFWVATPAVAIEIVTALEPINLTKREADISISFARPKSPGVIAVRLASCDIHLYASKKYLEKNHCPANIGDLKRHVFVDYVDELIEIPALGWLRGTLGQMRILCSSTSPLSQLSAVRSNVGIGMFADYLAADEPSLCKVLPEQVRAQRDMWLTVHHDLRSDPRVSTVFHFLKKNLGPRGSRHQQLSSGV